MKTERLHLRDSALLEFTADIIEHQPSPRGVWVRLDCTAFYAESGGQPCDTGDIAGVPVLQVQLLQGEPWHELPQLPARQQGVLCRVDARRRLDHMQQHLGQHMLSAVLYARGAATVGFHLGQREVTVDLDRQLSAGELALAEGEVNRIIWENRPVRVRFPDAAELAAMRLRSLPEVAEDIRIIEVEGLDLCPCGGTHPDATGVVGSLLLLGSERHKGGLRVRFVCGGRALAHAQALQTMAARLSAALSVAAEDLAPKVEALQQDHRMLKKDRDDLKAAVLQAEAAALAAQADPHRVLGRVLDGKGFDDARALAQNLAALGITALLAVQEGPQARVALASPGASGRDMGALLRLTTAALGGRGGGSPTAAQGMFPGAAQPVLDALLAELG